MTRVIVMLGTSENTMGGVSAVVRAYREAGLFHRWPVVYVTTHCDGSAFRKLILALWAYLRFLTLLCARRVGLLHVHAASNASFWRKSVFITLALAMRRPVIFHLHGGGFVEFYGRCGIVPRRVVRFVLEHVSHVVVVADCWMAELRRIAPRAKLLRIYNPLSAAELLVECSRAHECERILFLGRLSPRKGIDDLMQAFAAVHGSHPSSGLDVCGDGDVEQIRKRAEALGVAHAVRLHGWVTGDRKRGLLREAGVYVLPSLTEAMPMSVLEAMAAGLPLVVTPVGGVPELVRSGVEGYVVPTGDPATLASALTRLLSDGELRRRMGERGRQRVTAHFTPEKILSQVEALYRDLGWRPRHGIDRTA